MSSAVDDKDKQAFMDLQKRLWTEANNLKKVETQAKTAEQDKRRAELTLQEIGAMPEDVNTYRTIGRAFILVPKDDMQKELENAIAKNENVVKESKGSKVYLEKAVKETEDNIRELLRNSPALASHIAGVAG